MAMMSARMATPAHHAPNQLGLSHRATRIRAVRPQAFFGFQLPTFGTSAVERRADAKAELLASLQGLNRGVDASEEQRAEVDRLATALERLNPNKTTLTPELSGKWRLLYTTSQSILGSSRPALLRPWAIYQTIDVEKLRARNQESGPFFNGVTANLTPTSGSAVNVKFDTFYILGLLPFQAPETAKGSLRISYLDEDLRVSRGDKGNLFVLDLADGSARL